MRKRYIFLFTAVIIMLVFSGNIFADNQPVSTAAAVTDEFIDVTPVQENQLIIEEPVPAEIEIKNVTLSTDPMANTPAIEPQKGNTAIVIADPVPTEPIPAVAPSSTETILQTPPSPVVKPVTPIADVPKENIPAVNPVQNKETSVPREEQHNAFVDMLILYIPNRVMDLLDIADVSLGFGPALKANAWITRYMAFGGGIGGTAKVIKAYNRQYGAGLQSGWNASFMMLTAENTELYETTRGVQKYFEYHTGIPSIDDNVYNFWRGPRDIFSVGAELAIFGEIDVEAHPFEAIDFAAGLFFLDPKGDDIKMYDIKGE